MMLCIVCDFFKLNSLISKEVVYEKILYINVFCNDSGRYILCPDT